MPRYVVERCFPEGFPVRDADRCRSVVDRNADEAVTWLLSYVSEDRGSTFDVYEGPSPEAIRKAAALNRLPVDRITEVRVLDPYFYS
jgi:hypothetical protein